LITADPANTATIVIDQYTTYPSTPVAGAETIVLTTLETETVCPITKTLELYDTAMHTWRTYSDTSSSTYSWMADFDIVLDQNSWDNSLNGF
jgi:hypothetical protein